MQRTILALLLVGSPALSQNTQQSTESLQSSSLAAGIARTTDDDRRALSYAGRFFIRVTGLPALSLDQIADPRTFALFDAAYKRVTIRQATFLGTSGDWGDITDTEPLAAESPTYQQAALWGDFRAGAEYHLVVNTPDGARLEVDVEILADGDDDPAPLLHFLTDRMSLEFRAFTPDDGNEVGIRYDFDLSLGRLGTEHMWSLSLASQGELSTEPDSADLQSALSAGLQADYRFAWRTKSLLLADEYLRTYPVGLRLRPVEIEASSDFDNVNYTAKAQVAAAVPILDDLVLQWHQWTGVERVFFPATMFVGYTYVDELEATSERLISGDEHRLDLEFHYRFPLTDRLDARLQWRGFQGLETGEFVDRLDVGLLFYTDETRSVGVELMYLDGALPPEFRETSTLSIGMAASF